MVRQSWKERLLQTKSIDTEVCEQKAKRSQDTSDKEFRDEQPEVFTPPQECRALQAAPLEAVEASEPVHKEFSGALQTSCERPKTLSAILSDTLQRLRSHDDISESLAEAPLRNSGVADVHAVGAPLLDQDADLCKFEASHAKYRVSAGVASNLLQHLRSRRATNVQPSEVPLADPDFKPCEIAATGSTAEVLTDHEAADYKPGTERAFSSPSGIASSSPQYIRPPKVTHMHAAQVPMLDQDVALHKSSATRKEYKVSANVASSLLQHLRSKKDSHVNVAAAPQPDFVYAGKSEALSSALHDPLQNLRPCEVAVETAAEASSIASGTDGHSVVPPTLPAGQAIVSNPDALDADNQPSDGECSTSHCQDEARSDDEGELSSDGMEFDARWEEEPSECAAPSQDGPWIIKGLEFFSCFDSGNCAGVVETPVAQSQEDESDVADTVSQDVTWASARREEHSKLLYEVLHARCCVHADPHPSSKILTRKSRGAKFFAVDRITVNGWQALFGEKGWTRVFDSSLPVGQRQIARLVSHSGSTAVKKYGEPIRFCTLEKDAASDPSGKQVICLLIEGVYMLLRPDAFPSMCGIVLASEARNAQKVEEAAIEKDSDSQGTFSVDVTVRADCQGTAYAREDCQWFHFGIRGEPLDISKLRLRILGLSRFKKFEEKGIRKGPLLTDGVQPVFRYCRAGAVASSTEPEWKLVSGDYGVERLSDGSFASYFDHSLGDELATGYELYFALTFPYPLARIRQHVNMIHHQLISAGVYACRERLVNSLGGHPIELLTVTDRSRRCHKRQSRLEGLSNGCRRPRVFRGRQAIFISCRVHPGETPASYMLEGLLDFLASDDPAARELLQRYVFHVVPVLNPDGVALGHHRTDLLGENLNRVYGSAKVEVHPSIYAAEAACVSAHHDQGGLRLYLDLHAHSNRRGAFLLGDADVRGGLSQAKARLYGYALCRRCSVFEYSQSDFNHAVEGTGKSGISQLTHVPLCFTVESHYFRGHHSTVPFGPATWRGIGRSCLEALLDCDRLEQLGHPGQLKDDHNRSDMAQAMKCLAAEACRAKLVPFTYNGPGRARPHFGKVLGPGDDHYASSEIQARDCLIGRTVEIIEQEWRSADGKPSECWSRLHEVDGGIWLPSKDLEICDVQKGLFFYGVLAPATVTAEPTRGKRIISMLPPGTVLQAEERRVVDGWLRVKICADTHRGKCTGWISEYKGVFFDCRLGGVAQLMRLSGPRLHGRSSPVFYAFA